MTTKRPRTPTLQELKAQIAILEAQAEEIERAERDQVIARIKEAIAHYDLTASDLGLVTRSGPKASGRSSTAGSKSTQKAGKSTPGVAKYADGTGRTWTGHGKRPAWFVAAMAAGKTPEDMLVKSS